MALLKSRSFLGIDTPATMLSTVIPAGRFAGLWISTRSSKMNTLTGIFHTRLRWTRALAMNSERAISGISSSPKELKLGSTCTRFRISVSPQRTWQHAGFFFASPYWVSALRDAFDYAKHTHILLNLYLLTKTAPHRPFLEKRLQREIES